MPVYNHAVLLAQVNPACLCSS